MAMITLPSEFLFFAGYALDILGLYVLSKLNKTALYIGAFVNMLLISFFARKAITVFGIYSNVGNIFYSAVIFAMTLLVIQYGKKETLKTMHVIFVSMLMYLILSHFIVLFPILVGNEEASEFITAFVSVNVQVVTASFIAFYISAGINAFLLDTRHPTWQIKVMANIVAQLFDSLVFFPIAFYGVFTMYQIIWFMVGGFLLKSLLNVIDTPIVMLLVQDPSTIAEKR